MAQTTSISTSGVRFKGRMMTLTVLEIHETDNALIASQIDEQLARAPDFFARMPVLLSLGEDWPDLARLVEMLHAANLVVVGVLDPSVRLAEAAASVGLGILH